MLNNLINVLCSNNFYELLEHSELLTATMHLLQKYKAKETLTVIN